LINIWRSEIRKILRPRLLITNLTISIGLQVAFTFALFLKAKGDVVKELSRNSGILFGTKSVSVFLGILIYCIFASNIGQEYAHGTLKNLLVRQPNRIKLMLGKIFALTSFSAVLVSTVTAIGIALAYSFSSKAKVNTDNWSIFGTYFASEMLNILIAVFAYGLLGAAIAILLKSSIAAISGGLVWLLLVETLFGFLGKTINSWLPGNNFANLSQGGSKELGYRHSLAFVLCFSAVLLGFMLFIFKERDVAN
jgi:ABC-type transport system involved in multi-copper enzyme maturation permease subunit